MDADTINTTTPQTVATAEPHIHAALMLEYAKDMAVDKNIVWQYQEGYETRSGDWKDIRTGTIPLWLDSCKYRRKPRTININGFEVPEPLRHELSLGQRYYLPAFGLNASVVRSFKWEDDKVDFTCLWLGLAHDNEEAARIHAQALFSFTAIKDMG